MFISEVTQVIGMHIKVWGPLPQTLDSSFTKGHGDSTELLHEQVPSEHLRRESSVAVLFTFLLKYQ